MTVRPRSTLISLAGPLLIVGATVLLLRDYAFGGLVRAPHVDILPFWLPMHCFLGSSLAAGHIPTWNPFVMAGTPFAADPQSGWMYLPAMALYTLLPCVTALRAFILLQPIIAGLGLYAFFRVEGLSHPAASVAGVAIAVAIAGFVPMATDLPFAGTLAWTCVILAAAARYLKAPDWASRLRWVAAVALAWSQLAVAHLSDGMVMGTVIVILYLAAKLVSDLLAERRDNLEAALVFVLPLVALPLVGLAVFLPRLSYLSRAALGLGFYEVRQLAKDLSGYPAQVVWGSGAGPTWPLGMGRPAGVYIGAAALLLVFAAWRARRHLPVVVAFALFGLICYIAVLSTVARTLAPYLVNSFGNFYTHAPDRFSIGFILALAALAGLGAEAWRDMAREETGGRRALLLLPGLVVWGWLPLLFGQTLHAGWFAIGLVVGVGVLAAATWRPALVAAIPLVLVAEVLAVDLGTAAQARTLGPGEAAPADYRVLGARPEVLVDLDAYVRPSRITRALSEGGLGRSIPIYPTGQRGTLLFQEAGFWPLMSNQRSLLFDLETVEGYNPAQLLRFWSFVRATESKRITYNGAFYREPSPVVLDLFQVRWLIAPFHTAPPVAGVTPGVREGFYRLYRVPDVAPRASVMTSWRIVGAPRSALDAVASEGFRPDRELILEKDPGIPETTPPQPGTARFRWTARNAAQVEVTSSVRAIVLVRNPYDPNWKATVDGRPAEVFPADYIGQGIRVPRGTHTIRLEYRDGSILVGAVGSVLSLLGLFVAAYLLRHRRAYNLAPPEERPF